MLLLDAPPRGGRVPACGLVARRLATGVHFSRIRKASLKLPSTSRSTLSASGSCSHCHDSPLAVPCSHSLLRNYGLQYAPARASTDTHAAS
jgi:hypothetical protein